MSLFSPIEMDAEYNCVIMVILRTAVITWRVTRNHFHQSKCILEKVTEFSPIKTHRITRMEDCGTKWPQCQKLECA